MSELAAVPAHAAVEAVAAETVAPERSSAAAEAESAEASAARSAAVPKLEDDEDCGFCGYMRAGPCGDVFTAWEDCVKLAQSQDEDFARQCIGSTKARRPRPTRREWRRVRLARGSSRAPRAPQALTACMAEHKDYYGALSGGDGDEPGSKEA